LDPTSRTRLLSLLSSRAQALQRTDPHPDFNETHSRLSSRIVEDMQRFYSSASDTRGQLHRVNVQSSKALILGRYVSIDISESMLAAHQYDCSYERWDSSFSLIYFIRSFTYCWLFVHYALPCWILRDPVLNRSRFYNRIWRHEILAIFRYSRSCGAFPWCGIETRTRAKVADDVIQRPPVKTKPADSDRFYQKNKKIKTSI